MTFKLYNDPHIAVKNLKQMASGIIKKKKIIVIAGPTAVGKTKLSLDIAKIIGGEIISADSMQVYKGMDIGTDKVSLEERTQIPHHLIDIVKISEFFNVVSFYKEAHKACKDILKREKVPILVGGSGFYIHVFMYGPPEGPPANLEIRHKITDQIDLYGIETMYEKLQILDPKYAATITEHDKNKIIRALEIIYQTKRPVSSFVRSNELKNDYDYRFWFLCRPREEIYKRVDERCDSMVERGFIDEVIKLKNEGLQDNSSASQSIGYKQALEYLESFIGANSNECNSLSQGKAMDKFLEDFKRASRKFVKKQFTWFRKEKHFRWLDLSIINEERAKEYILQDYEHSF